jgi:hypothetical protein
VAAAGPQKAKARLVQAITLVALPERVMSDPFSAARG